MIDDAPPPPAPGGSPGELDSTALLGEAREVIIRHGAATYRLKLTRYGKLILTK